MRIKGLYPGSRDMKVGNGYFALGPLSTKPFIRPSRLGDMKPDHSHSNPQLGVQIPLQQTFETAQIGFKFYLTSIFYKCLISCL